MFLGFLVRGVGRVKKPDVPTCPLDNREPTSNPILRAPSIAIFFIVYHC